jgi:predicted component of type VI protein secretion system
MWVWNLRGDDVIQSALFGAAAATLWTVASAIGDVATDIVAVGGAVGVVVAGATWLWKKLLRPAAGAFRRTYDAVEALEELGDFIERTDQRLDAVEGQIGAFAQEDAARMRRVIDAA